MKKAVILFFTGFFLYSPVISQFEKKELITVKGTVTAFNIFQLSNAEITSKKTRTKCLTDTFGRFEIMVPSGDILTFVAMGFEKNKRKVNTSTDILLVNLILMDGDKNQEIALANGHISEENLTNALMNYGHFNNDFTKYHTMEELLRGEIVGAWILKGSYRVKVYLKGNDPSSTGFAGGGPALYVLDGVVTETIDQINPWDVKSIKVLKGVEANMYGSINTSGAILIETK